MATRPETLDLRRRIFSLPAELYDHILQFIFAFEKTANIKIDKTYIPPSILQINRTLRRNLLRLFYTTQFFEFQDPQLVLKWLGSLRRKDQDRLQACGVKLCIPKWPEESDHLFKSRAVALRIGLSDGLEARGQSFDNVLEVLSVEPEEKESR